MDTGLERQRCVRVPKIVKSDRRQLRLASDSGERPRQQVRMNGLAHRVGEHGVGVDIPIRARRDPRFALTLTVLDEHRAGMRIEEHRAPTPLRLGSDTMRRLLTVVTVWTTAS